MCVHLESVSLNNQENQDTLMLYYYFFNSWWREQSSFYKAMEIGYLLFSVLLESVFYLKCFISNRSLLLNTGLFGDIQNINTFFIDAQQLNGLITVKGVRVWQLL